MAAGQAAPGQQVETPSLPAVSDIEAAEQGSGNPAPEPEADAADGSQQSQEGTADAGSSSLPEGEAAAGPKPDENGNAAPEQETKPEEKPEPEAVEEGPAIVPLPTEEQIEGMTNMLAANPAHIPVMEKCILKAKQIVAAKAAGTPQTAEEKEAAYYAKLVRLYGKDFVTAKRGNNSGFFSRKTWNMMGKDKKGWAEVTKAMPEVAEAAKK